jgi:hypothetical protein
MITAEERQLGRAKNALMFYLERNLIVPKIYIDANWGGHHVDVLAIDRAGVGDVHALLLFQCRYDEDNLRMDDVHYTEAIDRLLDELSLIQANYKYVGVIGSFYEYPALEPHMTLKLQTRYLFPNVPEILTKSFSPDGLGRVGLVAIDHSHGDEVEVRLDLKPERFRAKIAKLADEYVQQHEADWEIRA